jgi:protein-tyrosine phosphatase
MSFIDLHTHVIPFVDDGALDWEMSLKMLQQAERDGIRQVVCTPHIFSKIDFDRESQFKELFQELVDKMKKERISLVLHLGAEIYIQPDLQLNRSISTLGQNGKYFLVEFPLNNIPDYVSKRFFEIVMVGKTPIIAHPERNGYILENIERAYDFVEKGALLQINSGSILGRFGNQIKKISIQLMNANLVHIVGSDAHDLKTRPLKLKESYEYVIRNWGEEKGYKLFFENPRKVLDGEIIHIEQPIIENVGNVNNDFGGRFKRFFKKI